MTDLPAPRRVERVLEALGADIEFRDAVIGDLAEEFAIRAREDGVGAAQRWYYRESLRVAPYLLRDWWRGLRPRDVGYFARTAGIAAVALIVFERLMGLATIAPGFRSFWEWLLDRGDNGVFLVPALMLAWTVIDGLFGGYVAARLGRRAPLASAVTLAVGWTIVMVALTAQSSGILLVFRVLNTAALATGIITGGVLGAMRRSPDDSDVASDAQRYA